MNLDQMVNALSNAMTPDVCYIIAIFVAAFLGVLLGYHIGSSENDKIEELDEANKAKDAAMNFANNIERRLVTLNESMQTKNAYIVELQTEINKLKRSSKKAKK